MVETALVEFSSTFLLFAFQLNIYNRPYPVMPYSIESSTIHILDQIYESSSLTGGFPPLPSHQRDTSVWHNSIRCKAMCCKYMYMDATLGNIWKSAVKCNILIWFW